MFSAKSNENCLKLSELRTKGRNLRLLRSLIVKACVQDCQNPKKALIMKQALKSAVIFQGPLEALAGEEDAALDGAERQASVFGDFGIFIAGDVHRERHLIGVFKRIYYRRDFF